MSAARELPDFDDLPIPSDVTVGTGWSPLMVEIADHIGPYATLKLLEAFGGEEMRISLRSRKDVFAAAIGEEASLVLRQTFDREKIILPTGRFAIWRAKAKPILERVRAGALTVADAARILRVAPPRIHEVMNQDGGEAPRRRRRVSSTDPRQIDMFPASYADQGISRSHT